jgi:hypothetical protein
MSLLFYLLLPPPPFSSLASLAQGPLFLVCCAAASVPIALAADDAAHSIRLYLSSCSRSTLPQLADLLVGLAVDGDADAESALPDPAAGYSFDSCFN